MSGLGVMEMETQGEVGAGVERTQGSRAVCDPQQDFQQSCRTVLPFVVVQVPHGTPDLNGR